MAVPGKIVAVLALVVAAACADESDEGAVEAVVTDQAGYAVGLLDPGGDERVTIRIANEPGTSQAVRMVMDQTQDISIGGQQQSIEMSQTMDVTYVVRSVDGELVTVDVTYDDMSVDTAEPDPTGVSDAMVGALVGQTAISVFTDRGGIVSIDMPDLVLDLDVPGLPAGALDDFFDQLVSSMEENADAMSVPAPVEPVGVGGSWSAASEAAVGGIPMELESTITITEITADRVVGDITQTLIFVEGPTEIFGARAVIDGGRLEGTGTITYLRQGGIVPLVDMETSGTVSFTIEGMTIDQTMTMRQTSTLR